MIINNLFLHSKKFINCEHLNFKDLIVWIPAIAGMTFEDTIEKGMRSLEINENTQNFNNFLTSHTSLTLHNIYYITNYLKIINISLHC